MASTYECKEGHSQEHCRTFLYNKLQISETLETCSSICNNLYLFEVLRKFVEKNVKEQSCFFIQILVLLYLVFIPLIFWKISDLG